MPVNLAPPADAVPTPLDPSQLAIAYIRVSLAHERTVSPEQQRHAIDEWAARTGHGITEYIIETDKSGRSFAKRRIAEAIGRVGDGEAKKIVVWKFSRFGRNATACGAHNDRLNAVGGLLVSATQPIDTSTPYGAFFLRMYFSMDELESDVIGMSWRETHQRRRRNGLPHTGQARFGYQRCPKCERSSENPHAFKYCDNCKGVFEIDPVRGPALAEAYERWTLQGDSLASIAKDMHERGIRSLRGNVLRARDWRQIMETGFAAGLLHGRSNPTMPHPPTGRPDEYDLWEPGLHEPLISLDLWAAYKSKLLDGKQPTAHRTSEQVWKYSLSGLLRCGDVRDDGQPCHRPMHAHPFYRAGRRKIQFRCPAREEEFALRGPTIMLPNAEGQVLAWLQSFASPDSSARAAYEKAMRKDERSTELDALDQDIAALERKLGRNKQAYLAEAIDLDEFRNTREELLTDLSLKQARKSKVQAAVASGGPPPADKIKSMLDYWPSLNEHDRHLALAQVIRHITVLRTPGKQASRIEIVPHWADLAA
jgi:DNA invertase Pin-like site-specific DNA recombinase